MYCFGGSYLDIEEFVFNDIQVSCGKAYLQTLEITQLSDHIWVPVHMANSKINMDEVVVNNFFNHYFLPEKIRKLII
jgi:hypothetical protein